MVCGFSRYGAPTNAFVPGYARGVMDQKLLGEKAEMLREYFAERPETASERVV